MTNARIINVNGQQVIEAPSTALGPAPGPLRPIIPSPSSSSWKNKAILWGKLLGSPDPSEMQNFLCLLKTEGLGALKSCATSSLTSLEYKGSRKAVVTQ